MVHAVYSCIRGSWKLGVLLGDRQECSNYLLEAKQKQKEAVWAGS